MRSKFKSRHFIFIFFRRGAPTELFSKLSIFLIPCPLFVLPPIRRRPTQDYRGWRRRRQRGGGAFRRYRQRHVHVAVLHRRRSGSQDHTGTIPSRHVMHTRSPPRAILSLHPRRPPAWTKARFATPRGQNKTNFFFCVPSRCACARAYVRQPTALGDTSGSCTGIASRSISLCHLKH